MNVAATILSTFTSDCFYFNSLFVTLSLSRYLAISCPRVLQLPIVNAMLQPFSLPSSSPTVSRASLILTTLTLIRALLSVSGRSHIRHSSSSARSCRSESHFQVLLLNSSQEPTSHQRPFSPSPSRQRANLLRSTSYYPASVMAIPALLQQWWIDSSLGS